MDVLITAGGTPVKGDLLFDYTMGSPKALLNVAGKPMVQWILDAVSASEKVEHITLIGLKELGQLTCPKPLSLLPNKPEMLANILSGTDNIQSRNPAAEHVLLVSSDIPAITTAMVDWMIDIVEKSDSDLFYNVIERPVMEKTYPDSRRTYIHLKDGEVCGGDVIAFRLDVLKTVSGTWQELIANRKNPLKQASILGFGLLLGILTRKLTLIQAAEKISHRLGINGKVIKCPYAEVGMDIDKPFQLEIVQKRLRSAV